MPAHQQIYNPSNKPNTCLWCGRKLKEFIDWHHEHTGMFGYEGDGHFCSLRCGYEFGNTFAAIGRRLRPLSDDSEGTA